MANVELTSTPIRKEVSAIVRGSEWLNAKDYGINGDNAVDNTANLQSLIDAIGVAKKNATIFFPDDSEYLFNGDYQDTARSNCIIKFPSVGIQDKYFTIKLKGFSKPTFSPSAFSSVPLPSATRLKTTKTSGTGTRPSFFGGIGPAGGDNGECSYCTVCFEDLLVQVPPNPNMTAVNMSGYTNAHTKNVAIIAGNSYGTIQSVEPTNAESFGYIQPDHGHGVYQHCDQVLMILGFYNGMRVGENCRGDEVEIWACKYGTIFDLSYGVSMIDRLSFGWTKTHMKWNDNHHINFRMVNIERWELGYGSVASRWYNWVADIDDPGHIGRGELVYKAARANIGGVPGLFTQPVGGLLYVRENGVAP